MEKRAVFIAVIIGILHIRKGLGAKKFTCGIINVYSAEYDAVNFAISNTSGVNNVSSVVLNTFNLSENIDLLNQASVFNHQNVVAIIEGSSNKFPACALSTVTGIPLIRLHGDSSDDHRFRCQKAVQMSAGYRDYAHASLDIIMTFRWEKIVLAFDESHLLESGHVEATLLKSKLTVSLVHISDREKGEDRTAPILRAMDEIKCLKPDVILLCTTKENIEFMLQQKPCQCNEGYKWILYRQVPLNLSCHPNNVVVAMKLPYIESEAPRDLENVVLKYDNKTSKDLVALAYDSVQVINQALNMKPCSLINETAISLEDREALLTCITKVNIQGLTGPVQFSESGSRKGINLDILNLRNNSFIKIGTWNETKGTVMFGNIERNIKVSSPKEGLEGRKLRAVVLENDPFVFKKQEGGTISYEGYCIDLLNELARILKFTFEIHHSQDGYYGDKTENGTWDGLIGELINERADIAVASLSVNEEREKVVDFTVPFMFTSDAILVKKTASKQTTDLLEFMRPFHSHVWFCTLGSLVIISVAVFATNYFSPYGYKDENGQGTSKEFSYFNSLWFAVACMLQQGGDNTPRSFSGRILAGCYWFCILILISTYTANLAAFLTVKNAAQPIGDLEDIAKSSYGIGLLQSSNTYETLKTSQHESHQKIWHKVQAEKALPHNSTQGIQWVRERQQYVFFEDEMALKHIVNQPPCDLTTVPGLGASKGVAFALQENDPHTKEFTLTILRLQDNNFLDGLRRKWWESSNRCSGKKGTALARQQIDLMSIMGVYLVLGVGMLVAFLALIAEICWNRRRQQTLLTKFRRRKTKVSPP